MHMRTSGLLGFVLFHCCLLSSQAVAPQPPAFFFGGRQVYVGMSQQEAVVTLSHCCVLSPPVESGVEKRPAPAGMTLGHMILPKEEPPQDIFGTIFFHDGKVSRITRPLAKEVDTSNEDVVAFARAIERSLLGAGRVVTQTTVTVSVAHERATNAESEVVSFSLSDGRGIELRIGTLDKSDPDMNMGKRDFVSLDETLEPVLER